MSSDSYNQADKMVGNGADEVARLLAGSLDGGKSAYGRPDAEPSSKPPVVAVQARTSPLTNGLLLGNTIAVMAIVGVLAWFITRPPALLSTIIVERNSLAGRTGEKSEKTSEYSTAASWGMAQSAFASGSNEQALAIFRQLHQAQPSEGVNTDLLRLRMGDCLAKLNRSADALKLYQSVSTSSSAVLSGIANLQLARIEQATNQPMQARLHVYRAAAVAALAGGQKTQREADFLAARALTAKVISLHNLDLPMDFGGGEQYDVLAGMDESAVARMADDAAKRLASASLGPQARKLPGAGPQRFDLTCRNATVEEVLFMLAGQIGANIRWMSVDASARRRPVTMACDNESPQRLIEVACGAAGLIARFGDEETIIYDPQTIASLKEQQALLTEETASAWRRLLLCFPEDRRIAQGQFALGAITEAAGDALGAINTYQMVANRYKRNDVAPLAMLRCARLRMNLRDFSAARDNLRDLVSNYPDCPYIDEAYLAMAQSTMEIGMLDEAIKAFNRLYLREVSALVKAQVCRGAGKCYYRKGEYAEASKWLSRFVNLAQEVELPNRADAITMLGKADAARGKLEQATNAFYMALAAKPDQHQQVDVVLELADVLTARQMFAAAIGALGQLENQELTNAQRCRLLVQTGQAYRMMGLSDKAVAYLHHGLSNLDDGASQSLVKLEIARCLRQVDQGDEAYKTYTEAMPGLSGQHRQEAACELAELCLKMSKPDQAVALCLELKKSAREPLLTRVCRTLAQAYIDQKDYANAAVAMNNNRAGGAKQ